MMKLSSFLGLRCAVVTIFAISVIGCKNNSKNFSNVSITPINTICSSNKFDINDILINKNNALIMFQCGSSIEDYSVKRVFQLSLNVPFLKENFEYLPLAGSDMRDEVQGGFSYTELDSFKIEDRNYLFFKPSVTLKINGKECRKDDPPFINTIKIPNTDTGKVLFNAHTWVDLKCRIFIFADLKNIYIETNYQKNRYQ